MDLNYRAGFAKQDMTCFIPGVGMMGYGEPNNVCREVGTKLWARAMVLKDNLDKTVIFLHLEQGFVTMALKEEILLRLNQYHPDWKIEEADLLVSAQHTHSAPGGYSHFPFYNLTVGGFQTKVFEKVVSSAVLAVEEAYSKLEAVSIDWGEVQIHPDKEVAFNRSMKPYLQNPDAPKLKVEEKHLGIDRKMQGLLIRNADQKLVGHLNWFAVHGTSISHFNQRIHHDNKGVAAELFEKNHPGCTAFFMQGAAGDVSPNFIWNKKKKIMGGKFADQYDNAAFNGEIQFRESEKITPELAVQGKIESYHCYVDMAKKSAPPAHGLAFLRGTLEGPGIPPLLATTLGTASRIRRIIDCLFSKGHREFYKKQGNKEVVLDHRFGTFVGLPNTFWKTIPVLPSAAHPVNFYQIAAKANSLNTLPWAPAIIPFQLFRIGNILIAAVPGEITTMSGKRLHSAIEKASTGCGVERIIISSYSNAYMGYITTAEEYELQAYEGGHNLYGGGTLSAVIDSYEKIVKKMKGDFCEIENISPLRFPKDEVARRSV